MSGLGKLLKRGAILALALLVVGCTAQYRNHGYIPNQEDLDNVIVGVDTRATLSDSIGRPSTSGMLEGGDWYYVKSEWRHFAFRAPEEVNREVLAIRFDRNDVVQNIERYGLEDGQVVVLSRRVTDSGIRGITFLRQLLGNIGNLSADQLTGN